MFSIQYTRKYVRPKKNSRQQNIKPKRKAKTFGKAIVAAWKDFCTTSSFVGFRYIYDRNRTLFDILFWALLMAGLTYGSIHFLSDFLQRYRSLSTTTIIESHHFLSSRSVFPAITACLSSRFSKSRVNRFVDEYINSNDDLKRNVNLTQFFKIFVLNHNLSSDVLSNAGRIFSTYNLTMRDMLNMTTEDCEEVFTICRWKGKMTPCTQIFKRTMAVGGFCCSFNFPMSPEDMKRRKWLRTNSFGLHGGLSFAFKTIPKENYFYKTNYGNTLRVVIHSPRTFPSFNLNDITIPKSMETSIEINNVYNRADLKLKSLPIDNRDCIFSSERTLQQFTLYSNSNCLIQCRIDRVMHNCGCVSYFFPSNDSDICTMDQYYCSLRSRSVGAKRGNIQVLSQFGDCDCPDDCVIIKQYTKVSSWDFTTQSKYSVDDFYANVTDDHGIVHISYGKSTAMRLSRRLSFDEIQLASNIGGIVALFMGCSFISVIEIVYFLTIRMLQFYNSGM